MTKARVSRKPATAAGWGSLGRVPSLDESTDIESPEERVQDIARVRPSVLKRDELTPSMQALLDLGRWHQFIEMAIKEGKTKCQIADDILHHAPETTKLAIHQSESVRIDIVDGFEMVVQSFIDKRKAESREKKHRRF